jgi:hypothetical protein
LVDKKAGWELKEMHATRIEPKTLPGDIELSKRMLVKQSDGSR